MGKERPFRLLTLAAILCRTRLWARRKPLWKAVPARTADLSRSTYRRNAPPSMKRPLGETRRAPQPVLPREVVCKRPGTSGGEAGALRQYLVPLRSFELLCAPVTELLGAWRRPSRAVRAWWNARGHQEWP